MKDPGHRGPKSPVRSTRTHAQSDPSPITTDDRSWISEPRIGKALLKEARRYTRAATAEELSYTSGLGRTTDAQTIRRVLSGLVTAGRLARERRQNPRALWEWIEVDSIPEGGAP